MSDNYTYIEGHLYIDYDDGVIAFTHDGLVTLRITHLRAPIPQDAIIDMVALDNLTSYTKNGELYEQAQ